MIQDIDFIAWQVIGECANTLTISSVIPGGKTESFRSNPTVWWEESVLFVQPPLISNECPIFIQPVYTWLPLLSLTQSAFGGHTGFRLIHALAARFHATVCRPCRKIIRRLREIRAEFFEHIAAAHAFHSARILPMRL